MVYSPTRYLIFFTVLFLQQIFTLHAQSDCTWKKYLDTTYTNLEKMVHDRPDHVLKISRERFELTHDYYWRYLEVKALSQIGLYDQTITLAYGILKELEKTNNIYLKAQLHQEIGFGNLMYGNFERANYHIRQCEKLAFKIKDYDTYISAYIDYASIYLQQGQPKKAIRINHQAYLLCGKYHLMKTRAPYVCLANIGLAYSISGDYTKAMSYYKRAYHYFIHTNSLKNIINIAQGMARCHQVAGNKKKELYYMEKALYYSKKLKACDVSSKTYDNLAEYYYNKGDLREAYRQKDSASFYYRSFINHQSILSINELNTYYDLNQKDLQLAKNALSIERKSNIIQKKRNEVLYERSKNRIILFSSIIVLLLMILIALWKRTQRMTKEQSIKQRILELELKALRAQMNPHFIFNCLSSIQHLFLIHSEIEANLYITKFSTLLRSVLEHSQRDTISLQEEIEMLTLYSDLENMQFIHPFEFRIETNVSVDPSLIDIPTMILQPFVENAIRHGFSNKDEFYTLVLSFHDKDGYLHCSIDDNGIGREATQKSKQLEITAHKSRGMDITNDRLDILKIRFNLDATMRIIDKKNTDGSSDGTRVEISLLI